MKRTLIIILFILNASLLIYSGIVKVTLKNGTTITGNLVTMNPTGNLVLQVAGQDLTIAMSEVSSIEDYQASNNSIKEQQDSEHLHYGAYEVLDHANYLDSIIVVIGGQELTMVLVRGGWFNMGFDGRHSWSMKSEPIHRVNLSSFYISKQYLNEAAVNNILGKAIKKSVKPKSFTKWKNVQQILDNLEFYHLPTEAEWEYAAITPISETLFTGDEIQYEWCSDFFGEYSELEQTNPKGCYSGNNHVVRAFSKDNNKWRRYKGTPSSSDYYNLFIRLAIDADKIKEIQ